MDFNLDDIDPNLFKTLEETNKLPRLLLKDLLEGDVLEIQTKKFAYTMRILNPKLGIVFIEDVTVKQGNSAILKKYLILLGSNIANDEKLAIRIGEIIVGFRLALDISVGGTLLLHPVTEVKLNGKIVLPDFSGIKPDSPGGKNEQG